eukprot:TRINITY_DN3480_c0_g2_i1.p2 TRINITY_DN3480_c0_g2~~TRINITY_DN3480_c0_g2_i1.p2  ORF type:complete len:130 (+),score=27.77 TRINITY_DN3480_c0_g2_i1:26-391(+)
MNLHRVSVLFFLVLLAQAALASWLEDFLTEALEEEEAPDAPVDCVVDWYYAAVIWRCGRHCECRRYPIIQRPQNGGAPCPDRLSRTRRFCEVTDTMRYRSLETTVLRPDTQAATETNDVFS